MVIYIFSNEIFRKMILPQKVSGVYQIYAQSQDFLANVEEINGTWHIMNNDEIILCKDGKESLNPELKAFEFYSIKKKTSEIEYYIIMTPLYDDTVYRVEANIPSLTMGSSNNDDVFYDNNHLINQHIKLNFVENAWLLETLQNDVYVSEKKVKNIKLNFGDYIFVNGLKIVVIGKHFIINNPNKKVVLKNGSFSEKKLNVINVNNPEVKPIPDNIPIFSQDDYFVKSPRFKSSMNIEKIDISEPPSPEKKNDTSLLLTIGPQVTMLSTSAITLFNYLDGYMQGTTTQKKFILSMVTVGATVASTFLWPTMTRIFNNHRIKKKEKKRQKKYSEYIDEKSKQIELVKVKQRQMLIDNNATLENCALFIANKSRNLWERNIEHDDFLKIRLGIGRVPTKIEIPDITDKFTIEDKDVLLTKLENVINNSKYVDDAPLSINLVEKRITGVTGRDLFVKKFLDGVFLQLMTFHSYTDLKIVVFTNADNQKKWDYLKVLPHCWNDQKTIRYFGTTIEEMNIVSSMIEEVFNNRINKDENEKLEDNGADSYDKNMYKLFRPYFLIFTDDINIARNIGIVKRILKYQKKMGFSLLIANDRLSTLPGETNAFINIDEKVSGLIGNELIMNESTQFKADFNENIDIYECASKLANIPIHIGKVKYELPSSISFLRMYNVGKVEQLNSLERWMNNNPVNSLSVPVGIDQNGELFKVDLHEKAYGPHGLVAGTTGSGKSEWIVTLILSLAVNFNPDEVQFVLIDYKGGGLAMSFENQEMGIKLPHLAGTITNLDKSAVNRAIASIESELKRRQSIFNQAREKLKESSMNIYKYQQFYRKGMVDEPLSHLFIISDEFAELKSQQPEFMDQLISTSRIGRSLGVHLILATQKPSGVVNDQIWSNSRFKICFRVQDKGDSNEILKKPDAAYLKQVGAFYFEVGNDEYYNLGQSAWAGAKYYPSDIVKTEVDQTVQPIDNLGKPTNEYDDIVEDMTSKTAHGEELLNVIKYIDNISKKENFVKTQLWLPNIPAQIYINDIKKKYNHKANYMTFDTVIGEYDEPRKQLQNVLKVNLLGGNIAMIGQMGSGTDELVSSILWSSITEHTPEELNYYIIDFGAEILRMFAKFPQVGEIAFQDKIDRVADIIQFAFDELEKRKELMADYNGSFELYNKSSGKTLPLIGLIINSFDVFAETIPQLAEALTSFFRDAPRYGIICILSASSSNAIRQRQLQYFNHIIALQLNDDSQYRALTDCRRGLIPMKTLGRGICKTGLDADSYCEFQTAFIAPEEQLVAYVRETAKNFAGYYKTRAKQLPKIPDTVSSKDMIQYITDISSLPVGFNFYEKNVSRIDLSNSKIYLISSKNIKNNMNFIYGFANLLSKVPKVKTRIIDIEGIFKEPILDVKLFNEKLDVIFAALDKDSTNRTETQDIAINIILGAGSMKKKLSSAGYEIAKYMFDNVNSSKNIIYILVDSYDKMKNLKIESWFNYVDTTKGIWLGQGLDNQSLLISNELSQEDKKYDYDGMGFVIENSEYILMKTILDGDD